MKCKKCGAVLLDTDTFCVKCGQKVDQQMFCSNCGELLREGEHFCHKCGAPVDLADEEIALSQQRTVDIPFDQIEQGILLEAEHAIGKRPGTEHTERRNPDSYRQPGAEPAGSYRPSSPRSTDSYRDEGSYRARPARNIEYYDDIEEDEEPYEEPVSRRRRAQSAPPRRYEEDYGDYEDYDDYDDDEEEDSGDSKMKVITVILGIIVIAIALAIGFILWQRNNPSGYERPDAETEQGEDAGEGNREDGDDPEDSEGENSADTQGRIQILKNVNVRNAPTTDGSEVLMVAKTGETYEYYELVDNAWYHIQLEDGGEGYVSKDYVEDLQ